MAFQVSQEWPHHCWYEQRLWRGHLSYISFYSHAPVSSIYDICIKEDVLYPLVTDLWLRFQASVSVCVLMLFDCATQTYKYSNATLSLTCIWETIWAPSAVVSKNFKGAWGMHTSTKANALSHPPKKPWPAVNLDPLQNLKGSFLGDGPPLHRISWKSM